MPDKRTLPMVLKPDLQVAFYYRLKSMRGRYLSEALRETVGRMDLKSLDGELAALVGPAALSRVASFGLRGEVFFATPLVLIANPYLLGYYRLLLGLSQKEFYAKGPFGAFLRMEDGGEVTGRIAPRVEALCRSLIASAQMLVGALDELSLSTVHELQLLTLGPQLRGSENTRLGQTATKEAYEIVMAIVRKHIKESTDRTIVIENESGRKVMIEFGSDPDIAITEVLVSGVRPLVSVEIKGGTDYSNVHNRLGEAEKSHQKARNRGFFEFWTIVRVNIDEATARRESPTTSHFFHLDRIGDRRTAEGRRFSELLSALLGIRY